MNDKKIHEIPEIQIWNCHNPIEIGENPLKNKFKIQVKEGAELPEKLEDEVNNVWKKSKERNKKLKNGSILYLDSIKEKDGVNIQTIERGFKFTYAFNRKYNFYFRIKELNEHKLLSISTHCHLLTSDNKLLYGVKTNQNNQISGFSGFPNLKEDGVESKNGEKYLDIYRTIYNRLEPEIGELVKTVKDIDSLGVTYVDTPGLRGTDSDYLINIDVEADKAEKMFPESFQFKKKKLMAVDFNPDEIMKFVGSKKQDMSRYALGCIYMIMKGYFPDKIQEFVDVLREDKKGKGITISDSNQMNYLNK